MSAADPGHAHGDALSALGAAAAAHGAAGALPGLPPASAFNAERAVAYSSRTPRTPRTPRTIRENLTFIVVAALLPMGLFSVMLFYFLWQSQLTQRDEEQLARVRTMAALIQSELNSSVRRLELLGRSPLLTSSTMPAFYAQLQLLLPDNEDWSNVLLISREEQVLNARLPYGSPLPRLGDIPYQRAAFETGKPQVSDVFMARTRPVMTVDIAVPVMREGQVAYLLIASLRREHMADLLRKMNPGEGIASVYDRNMRFVARTKDQDTYMGQLPGPTLQNALRNGGEGVVRSRTKENIAVFTAWATLENGWSVAAGTPAAGSDYAFYRFVALLGGAWLVMLLTGIVMARILYSRIDKSLVSTVEVAKRRASGESAAFPESTFAELVELSGAIEKLFEQEREARAQAENANQAKDEFLAMLGHELRNPIGAIANASHILEQPAPRAEELAMAHRVIARQTGNLRRMIDDLLDLSRVLTGKIGLEHKPVDLAQCVRHAVESLDAVGRTALHRIELRTTPVWIEGDSARIEQILTNLIVNAVNHTAPGKRITITLSRETAQPRLSKAGGVAMAWDGDAVLEVADEGIGMAPTTLPRVFDLFFQEQQQADRPKSGLGLGLTLVQRLAELHGGSVSAASEGLGHGARFTVRIPAIPAPVTANPMTTPASPPSPAPTPPAGRRILLIEDNDDGRETMQAMLELDHHVVAAAADGPAGLALLKEFHADAAIIDVGLPGLTGHEVAQAIRAADVRGLDGSPLLLIALTGYGMPEDVKRTKDAGFDAHLVKPADFDKLTKLLAKKA